MPTFINDGYTRETTIEPEPGFHDGLIVTYRPMLTWERDALLRRIRVVITDVPDDRIEAAYERSERIVAEKLASKIVEWNADAEITADNVFRLEPHLHASLLNVIGGIVPPSENGQSSEPESAKN